LFAVGSNISHIVSGVQHGAESFRMEPVVIGDQDRGPSWILCTLVMNAEKLLAGPPAARGENVTVTDRVSVLLFHR